MNARQQVSNKIILGIISLLSLGTIELEAQQHLDDAPNFIFILTDDQSYGYMGCTGNNIVKTPHLDKLAQEGTLFTNAHITSAICTPSRASILSSQFERKHGINFNSGTSMSEEGWKNTYPMVMRAHGYYTGWIGKNHVPVGEGGYSSGIMERSFDYWYAGHGHLGFYPKKRHEIFKEAKLDTQLEVVTEGINDFLSNEQKMEGAIKFLDQRPENKPFMLSVCLNLPHGAGTSSMELRDSDDEIYKTLFRDMEIPMPEYYVAKSEINKPKLPVNLLHAADRQVGYNYVDTPEANKERLIRQYQAMTGIDRLVGKLRDNLKSKNLDKNTVLVFTSDHGLFMGQFGLGGKALCYETVTHVPMIIYDPSVKKRKKVDQTNALVQSIDVAPTVLSRAGIPIPESYQGKDINGLLRAGETEKVRDYLFTENLWSTKFGNPRCESVQNKEWKYIRYYKNNNFSAQKLQHTAEQLDIPLSAMLYKVHDPEIAVYRDYIESPINGEVPVYEELYHLAKDPGETNNLAGEDSYDAMLEKMRDAWKIKIKNARGSEPPMVLRYTADSEAERGIQLDPK